MKVPRVGDGTRWVIMIALIGGGFALLAYGGEVARFLLAIAGLVSVVHLAAATLLWRNEPDPWLLRLEAYPADDETKALNLTLMSKVDPAASMGMLASALQTLRRQYPHVKPTRAEAEAITWIEHD